ncbi:hypothetical protein ACFL3S_11475 [Gemmatimonadota bacterium]
MMPFTPVWVSLVALVWFPSPLLTGALGSLQDPAPLRLTTHPAQDYHPVFSPDGQTVLFTSQRGEEAGLWTVPSSGGDPARIPLARTGDLYADWAPDGESVVLDLREEHGPPDIYRYFFGNGELRQLTDSPGLDAHPAFSPDGAKVLFTSFREGREDIWVMSSDGTSPSPVTHDEAPDWHPRWSPDGTQVVFTSDRGGDEGIWFARIRGRISAISLTSRAERIAPPGLLTEH